MAKKTDRSTTIVPHALQSLNQSNLGETLDAERTQITTFAWDVFARIKDQLEDTELVSVLETTQEIFITVFNSLVDSLKLSFSGNNIEGEVSQFPTTILQTVKDFIDHETSIQNYNQLVIKITNEAQHVLATTKQQLIQHAPTKQQGSMIFNVLTLLENQMLTTFNKILLQIEQELTQNQHQNKQNKFKMTVAANTERPVDTQADKAKR